MRARQRALTIVELLSVIAIVLIVMALVSFVIAGKLRKSALKTVATQRLRQTAMGVNLYIQENGFAPDHLSELRNVEYWSPVNKMPFLYSSVFEMRYKDRVGAWIREFDAASDPILRDQNFPLKEGKFDIGTAYNVDGELVPYRYAVLAPGEVCFVLSGFLDGSVRYANLHDTFYTPKAFDPAGGDGKAEPSN